MDVLAREERQLLCNLQRAVLQPDDTACFPAIRAMLDSIERRVLSAHGPPGRRKRPRDDGERLRALAEQVDNMRKLIGSLQSFQVQVDRLMLHTVGTEMAQLVDTFMDVVYGEEGGGVPAAAPAPNGRPRTEASRSCEPPVP